MLDLSKLSDEAIRDIAYNLGAENEQEVDDCRAEIAGMTPRRAFVCYCTWHGLLGYGGPLFDLVTALQESEAAHVRP